MNRWDVESSHMVAVPKFYMAGTVESLKRLVQLTADSKKRRPIVGLLEYSHFVRDGKEMLLVFFRDQHNKKRRFMRLARSN